MPADAAPTTLPLPLPILEALLLDAQAHGEAGRLQEAEAQYHAVLAIDPGHAHATYLLGLVELRLDRPAALVRLATALKAAPQQEAYWLSYVEALIARDEFAAARQVLEMGRQRGLAGAGVDALAARLTPVDAAAMAAAMALLSKRQLDDALAGAAELVRQHPSDAFGYKIEGAVRHMRGQFEACVAPMQRATAVAPDDAEAHANLGGVYNELHRFAEAEQSLRSALRLRENDADCWNGLGTALRGLADNAEAAFRRALALRPDFPEALNNLAVNLQDQGRLAEAVQHYQHALTLRPGFHGVRSNMLFCLSQMAEIDAPALLAAHRAYGAAVAAEMTAPPLPHANTREPGRPLRIGFVSGDLRNHALASFIEPILACLALRPGVQLWAYSNHPVHDAVTARLRSHMHGWQDIHRQSDDEAAACIRADAIDILIDLSGHTAFNRLPLFARKPAPVQVSWIGYPGTTGVDAIDYYLTDSMMLPPGRFDEQFVEQLVQLPLGAPFERMVDAPPVSPLPALANGYFTFGSFNRPSKISRAVIGVWARLLRDLPDARLLIGGMPEDGSDAQLVGWLAEEGIARSRLLLHRRSDMHAYLVLHQQVDLCLDTFPYSGGTTTLHALSMGVPTLTMAGATAAGRQSACILEHHGLQALVAHDADDFVAKGLAACAAPAQLAEVRASLRQRFPLADGAAIGAITDGVATALTTMWQRWCSGAPAASFVVAAQAAAPAPAAPAPAAPIYVTRPDLPPLSELIPLLEQIWDKRVLTNGGPFHQRFESELAAHLGVEHLSLFSNGTIALMTALQALGVKGEVITTPYSFVATSHALLWNGLTPVFVDIDPHSFNLDPARIEAAITPRTSAILPVHCYGRPCDVEGIGAIAARHGLHLIYDAAHAFGVRHGATSVLEHGDLAVLSFHATKVFNTFEGGAIVCRDARMKQRIDQLKNFGITDEVSVVAAGLNGKMSEFNAALGVLQLGHVASARQGRQDVDRLYRQGLAGIAGIVCPPFPADSSSNFGYFPILVGPGYHLSRDALYDKLRAAGVVARRYFYPLISQFPMYQGLPSAGAAGLPHASRTAEQVLCLPIFPTLGAEQVERIVALIAQGDTTAAI